MVGKMGFWKIFQLFCLLTVVMVQADSNLKTEIGEKFFDELKRYDAEMLKANLESLKQYYTTLINDIKLRPIDEKVFRARLESVEEMKGKIGDTISPEVYKMVLDFFQLKFTEQILFRSSPQIAFDAETSKAFDENMKKFAENEIENNYEFLRKMTAKWKELYETIPKEDLDKNIEYKILNESIENLNKLFSSSSSSTDIFEKSLALAETVRQLQDFFYYSERNSMPFNHGIWWRK